MAFLLLFVLWLEDSSWSAQSGPGGIYRQEWVVLEVFSFSAEHTKILQVIEKYQLFLVLKVTWR